ncbi:uncharacterized protein LAESUDRAFT_714805 [Laetiporus sulphureus 93-53]|uniref:Spindle pole body component n=1 Tax=Laetiporus sulphureus 93-53 TaxID=1314785 RepID=A0A165DSS9_9APHY|nr:uncharacterized protein LAESUDRAFT_714805 [Laetiporus sulphureus 93-53]KZT05559.1 hypothetical protein LAESUDRAFT_714805 [Laetiporus sulphureus 93-53]
MSARTSSAPTASSSRPTSRSTQRSASRFSHRPFPKQSSRLVPHYQALVKEVTGLTAENDSDRFHTAVDHVSKRLNQTVRPSGSYDIASARKHIAGHIEKARINSHNGLASAMRSAFERLQNLMKESDDLDAEIKISLSLPPSSDTLWYAEEYLNSLQNPSKDQPTLTWNDIIAEEPFEGEHWEGVYGMNGARTPSGGSTPSLSPWEDLDELDDLDDSSSSSNPVDSAEESSSPLQSKEKSGIQDRSLATYDHRQDVEDLQGRQYWRTEWRIDVSTTRPFNIGDASTLGPSTQRILTDWRTLQIAKLEQEAIREVLMGLQGRRNITMEWTYTGDHPLSFIPTSTHRLLHLTSASQHSIISSFARLATIVEHLRKFVVAIFQSASLAPVDRSQNISWHQNQRRTTLSLEALSSAIDAQIRGFDTWCAAREEEMCKAQAGVGPPLVVSLLSMDKAIRDRFFATFAVLLTVVRDVATEAARNPEPLKEIWTLPDLPPKMSPSTFSTLLLNSLLDAAQKHFSMGDVVTCDALMQVFGETAEPLWSMMGRWMKDGMSTREVASLSRERQQTPGDLDDEFFIEDNELPMLDPDFWSDGFVLRGGQRDQDDDRPISVPTFLTHIAKYVLEAGKAIGLLRALGVPSTFEREVEQQWMASWRPFRALLGDRGMGANRAVSVQQMVAVRSTDDLSRLIYDEILPHSLAAQEMLQKVLVEECDLWLHLAAMEDLFLMRRGDAMSNFVDRLFARMDTRKAWNDFHFLNSAFHDVVQAGSHKWIDASLVRFSHRGSRDKTITRTIKAIDGLLIEYAVPFPLTYIFAPRVMQVYSSIFCFILQIRRAKSVLERILIRSTVANMPHVGSEMKLFYAMRSKLSWFVNTLLNFVATNVLHTQVLNFHNALKKAKSLNEMIALHDEHLAKIEGRCLLQKNTNALYRSIISILDMCLHFSDYFVTFAGDTTHDISRHSILIAKRHRSRRVRRQRKDIIGFSHTLREVVDSSSESESDLDEDAADAPEPSFSLGATMTSMEGDDFIERLHTMSKDLDAIVRFIRRGVESLAAGSGEAASAFGIFAFALEDWDR